VLAIWNLPGTPSTLGTPNSGTFWFFGPAKINIICLAIYLNFVNLIGIGTKYQKLE
jgi:hypothetical protein